MIILSFQELNLWSRKFLSRLLSIKSPFLPSSSSIIFRSNLAFFCQSFSSIKFLSLSLNQMATYAELVQMLEASRREVEQLREEKNEIALEAMDLRDQMATRDYEDLNLHNEWQGDFGDLTYRNWMLGEEVQELTTRVGELENAIMEEQFLQDMFVPEHVPHVDPVEIVLDDAPEAESESE